MDWKKLIISLFIPQLAGTIGSVFTSKTVTSWYTLLEMPWYQPPSWIFGPVWTLLFILMGISFYFVWKEGWEKTEVKIAIGFFSFQLVLNVLWSFLFFWLRNPGYALIEIFILWITILGNIIIFYKVSKKAAYLLIPYLLWVTFAILLNFAIFRLN
jgi:tryptophan-rich sensory protein